MPAILRLVLLCVCLCSAVGTADAKLTKYYYLKSGGGVWFYKSKAACEAAKIKMNAEMERLLKSIKPGSGRVVFPPPAYCLDRLPYGYERPHS